MRPGRATTTEPIFLLFSLQETRVVLIKGDKTNRRFILYLITKQPSEIFEHLLAIRFVYLKHS